MNLIPCLPSSACVPSSKLLPSIPLIFNRHLQEHNGIQQPAAGLGGKRPPSTSTCSTLYKCSSLPRAVSLLQAVPMLKATKQMGSAARGDTVCDSCQHSLMHKVERFASANHLLQQMTHPSKFIPRKSTSLSFFSFRPANEAIQDSLGILCLHMKLMLLWGVHYQLTSPGNEVQTPQEHLLHLWSTPCRNAAI